MRLLVVDTATPQATVAVCDEVGVLAERQRQVTTHSEGLLELIDGALHEAATALDELDALACGRGPGSFTGLRIGLATIKGLCLATGRPLVSVPSMVGVAGQVARRLGAGQLTAVVLDARRDEVFCGLFEGDRPLSEEVVLPPAGLQGYLRQQEPGGRFVLAGDGALRYQAELFAELPLAPPDCHQVRAAHLAPLARRRVNAEAFDDLAATVPRYIRPPDARLPDPASAPRPAPSREDQPPTDKAELLEILRVDSGLRLDQEGRWWHRGQPVEHPRLAAALHRWLDQLDDGRFVVRVDADHYAVVELQDAPYVVRSLQAPADDEQPVQLLLSDGTREPLDPGTLAVGSARPEGIRGTGGAVAENVLYCRVKSGRFDARFSRPAYYMLAQWIEQAEPDRDDRFAFCRGSVRVSITDRTADRATGQSCRSRG